VAIKHNLYIMSDEIYEHLTYDGAKHYSPAAFSPEAYARTIIVSGFAKTYAMTGWRLGTTVAPAHIAKAIAELQSQTTSNATTFAQYGAVAALKEKDKTDAALKTMLVAFDRRRKFLHAELNKIPGIRCLLAEGAFYLFPNISSFGLSSVDFCARLLDGSSDEAPAVEAAPVEEPVSAAITTPQPIQEAEEDVSFDEEPEQAAATPAVEELSAEEPEPVVSEDDGRYSSTGAFTEDVSAVYGGEPEAPPSEESEPLEAADAAFDVGFEEEPSRPAPPVVDDSQDEIGIDLDVAEEPAAPAPVADEGRRALLLYQEGTAEEQIYPFTGEVLTIGRGRDNDIQNKNDSKVSRFHCKLFRRNGSFYIEDNKSSNGTLVNGELITERRLFGGEEVIIGETYFRFRIM
jgi:hypothetical protein